MQVPMPIEKVTADHLRQHAGVVAVAPNGETARIEPDRRLPPFLGQHVEAPTRPGALEVAVASLDDRDLMPLRAHLAGLEVEMRRG